MRYRMDAPPEEYDAGLDELFVSVEPHRLDLKLWAIQQKMTVLEDLGRVEESSTLLSRHAPAFRESDLASRFEFLEALLMYKTGHLDEAEARLRDLRGGLEPSDESYAMSGWLLGRVVMGDGDPERPQEALSFFEDVLHHYSSGPYAVATRVAQGEALSMLERFDDAVEAFETAIEGLKSLTDYDLVNRDVLRTSLSVLAETQRQRAQLASAVRFARLASSLLDLNDVERAIPLQQQFARLLTLHAEALGDVPVDSSTDFEAMIHSQVSTEASDLFSEAAEVYAALARQHMLNERFASQASWLAAELFARANKRKIAASHFERFANERPSDPLVPRALLRVGQLHQHRGDFARAIDAYRACYRRFPLTLDGARALVPLAQCYLASGSRGAEHAEQVLRIVLEESEVFTPQAPEFANALFLMGDILNRSGAHERAIASLEEALDRYPRDPRKWPARFQLADAYRKSALKLKRETQDARLKGTIERMKAESSARLVEASGMYRQLIESYESRDPSSLSAIERMYLRQARLYEADCYFENGDFVSALRLYEEAAGIFRGTATTLAAYVQIVNCHVFLGQLEPARAALARATILVDAVPAEAFASAISSRSRDDWKRYFEWLENSELF
jgi:tetratricopeptide (TPR) repeat protein